MTDLAQLFVLEGVTVSLVASRLAGFIVTSPLPGEDIPAPQRVALVAVLSLVIGLAGAGGAIPRDHVPIDLDARLVGAAVLEVVSGALMGFTVRLTLAAVDVLGGLASHATGLGTPSVFNPALGTTDTPIARITTLLGLLIAFSVGLHRVALGWLLESFHALPVGSGISIAPAVPQLIGLAADSIAAGVRLAAPLVAVSLGVQITLALVARAAPSLQLFSIGFAILAAVGIATYATAMRDIARAYVTETSALPRILDRVVSAASTGSAPPPRPKKGP